MARVEKRGGKTAAMWAAEIGAAEEAWRKRENDREILRDMVGENLSFPPMMFGGSSRLEQNAGRDLYAHIDQLDINLPLRYVNKVRALVSDEEPETRMSRDMDGWNLLAQDADTLVTTLLGEGGAPAEMADAAAQTCTDGISTLWIRPNVPMISREEFHKQGMSVQDRVMAGMQGADQPSRVDDHLAIAKEQQGVAMDPQMLEMDPSGQSSENLIDARTEHLEAHQKEQKDGLDWQTPEPGVVVERLPYGTKALMDSSATSLKRAEWVADLISMPEEEAKVHKSLRPVFRENIHAESTDDKSGNSRTTLDRGDGVPGGNINPMVNIWRIWHRKTRQVFLIHKGCKYFGEVDSTYPYVDQSGNNLIKPLAGHPGWFPCWMEPVLKPIKDDHQRALGTPILLAGLKVVLAITKDYSYYHNCLKRAASTQYVFHPACEDEFMDTLTAGVDGEGTKGPAGLDDMNQAIVPIRKELPPPALFGMISSLMDTWCIVQSFPKLELTTMPNKDSTATQDQMAQAGGDLFMKDTINKFQVAYSWIALQVFRFATFLPQEKWVEVLGDEPATLLRGLVQKVGIPNRLPKTRFASGERDRDPIRIKQGLDLHEREKSEVNALGMPELESVHLLNETSKALGYGPVVKRKYSDEQIQAVMQMQQSESGQKKAPGEKEPSSKQKRDRPRNRGGRQGRASNSNPNGKEAGASNNKGPA